MIENQTLNKSEYIPNFTAQCQSDEQILKIRNNLLDAIDAEMLIQGTDDNQDYLDLVDSYVAVYKFLTENLTVILVLRL